MRPGAQVWMDITSRLREALQGLEKECPPNVNQLAAGEAGGREPSPHRRLKSEDPVLPRSGAA